MRNLTFEISGETPVTRKPGERDGCLLDQMLYSLNGSLLTVLDAVALS